MQTAALLKPSNKSLLFLEVIASGTGGGPEFVVPRGWHLPLPEAEVMVQRWATGRQKALALLQGGAALGFSLNLWKRRNNLGCVAEASWWLGVKYALMSA